MASSAAMLALVAVVSVAVLPAGGAPPSSTGAAPPAAPAPAVVRAVEPSTAPVPGRPAPAGDGWTSPVQPVTVVRRFVVGPHPWSPGHRGVDLAAPAGTPVRAPAAGRVTFAGPVAGRPVVVLTHAGGLRSTFVPAVATVPVGTLADGGTTVATTAEDDGHCPSGRPCLHWGLVRSAGGRDEYVDPLARLVRAPVVLLPLGGVARDGPDR